MRLHLFLLAALLGATPVMANDPPPKPEVTTPARPRLTTEQRFNRANTTGDGQLTLEQAKSGYKTVARNFATIDVTNKGFVTIEDIQAWHKAVREARRLARAASNDPLRPRQALQRTPVDQAVTSPPMHVQGPPAPLPPEPARTVPSE